MQSRAGSNTTQALPPWVERDHGYESDLGKVNRGMGDMSGDLSTWMASERWRNKPLCSTETKELLCSSKRRVNLRAGSNPTDASRTAI